MGTPHFGHEGALSETSESHSGHGIGAMLRILGWRWTLILASEALQLQGGVS